MSKVIIPEGIKKIATLCVLRNGSNLMLLKRLKEPNKDMYTPVGGKIEPFETPEEGVIRETFEETGIKVEKVKFCGILTETSPVKYNWLNYVYAADIDAVTPPECNEGTLEWIAYEDLLNVPTPKTDWFIYKYILENKPFVFHALYDGELNLLEMKEEITGLQLSVNG
ncbi:MULTISPECIES: NUDIX hydrolase [Myroides]|uniref:NUDIX domain-containing protein n=1 Tax=Myroides albus TaxID=2562892 RepID=A0A6I3LE79_9FLAO|nr:MULTISPECIES: NUDIX domain-containing protein [Myroides]MTG96788.1 NUDIX domain-containing protein [Myroides albus]MVX36164.1 NUDIX domain-containing protein [Myroides sp. LoEW2-1]UVD80800.1 NUDIX domain-containing protein [Myroides albus]